MVVLLQKRHFQKIRDLLYQYMSCLTKPGDEEEKSFILEIIKLLNVSVRCNDDRE